MNTENVSTLKIHKLTREQYERELGAGRIDPMAIYLTPNEELLSIEQGGTGANNAADALVNLGAAPSGYGLGDSVWISDGRSANDMMSNGWFSWGSGGVVDVPFPTGYMFVVARQSGKHVTQFALNANYTGTGNTQTAVRTYGTTGWSEWTNISPSAFAPSGYGGYGETCPYFIVTNETDFESELTNIVNNIQPKQSVRFTFMIGSIAGVTIGDWQWIATIHKTSAKYAFVSAQCGFGSRITKIEKVLSNGVWQPCEWVNPPMIAGVEYRTTERVGDRPVYAYLFNYGYYSTDTTVIPHNLSVYQPVSIDITNNLQEILTNSSGIKELSFNRTNINISCDWNMGNVHFIMKYTK